MLSRRKFVAYSGVLLGSCLAPGVSLSKQQERILELKTQTVDIHLAGANETVSRLWSYNGVTPGPEIRALAGERVRVRLINELPEPTSIHWHGVRIDNAMDGVAGLTQSAIEPGESFEYDFIAPDAGTYWYHAHNKSWNQVGRGLYGPLIIDEKDPPFDKDHDLTLLIDDWRLDESGALHVTSFGALHDWSHAGRLGNFLTVNGKSNPTYKIRQNEAYRIRLINSSNARILTLNLDKVGAKLLALDGQPLPSARRHQGPFDLAPAQRVDLLMVPSIPGVISLEIMTRQGAYEFARFNVEKGLDQPNPVPRLLQNDIKEPNFDGARIVPLTMTGGAMGGGFGEMTHKGKPLTHDQIRQTGQVWAFNTVANIAEEPLMTAKRGETIIVEMKNDTAFPHAMHVHGHHFFVLNEQNTAGDFRDTVLIHRNDTVRIAFVADNPGKWLLHCHMLEHAAAGMNTWFQVI